MDVSGSPSERSLSCWMVSKEVIEMFESVCERSDHSRVGVAEGLCLIVMVARARRANESHFDSYHSRFLSRYPCRGRQAMVDLEERDLIENFCDAAMWSIRTSEENCGKHNAQRQTRG